MIETLPPPLRPLTTQIASPLRSSSRPSNCNTPTRRPLSSRPNTPTYPPSPPRWSTDRLRAQTTPSANLEATQYTPAQLPEPSSNTITTMIPTDRQGHRATSDCRSRSPNREAEPSIRSMKPSEATDSPGLTARAPTLPYPQYTRLLLFLRPAPRFHPLLRPRHRNTHNLRRLSTSARSRRHN